MCDGIADCQDNSDEMQVCRGNANIYYYKVKTCNTLSIPTEIICIAQIQQQINKKSLENNICSYYFLKEFVGGMNFFVQMEIAYRYYSLVMETTTVAMEATKEITSAI